MCWNSVVQSPAILAASGVQGDFLNWKARAVRRHNSPSLTLRDYVYRRIQRRINKVPDPGRSSLFFHGFEGDKSIVRSFPGGVPVVCFPGIGWDVVVTFALAPAFDGVRIERNTAVYFWMNLFCIYMYSCPGPRCASSFAGQSGVFGILGSLHACFWTSLLETDGTRWSFFRMFFLFFRERGYYVVHRVGCSWLCVCGQPGNVCTLEEKNSDQRRTFRQKRRYFSFELRTYVCVLRTPL